eukprot:3590193-Lingulodinium_polyedra.AAC.1
MADIVPPDAVPTTEQIQALAAMEPEASALLRQYRVPYSLQTAIAVDGYATMLDLADRWITKEDCRAQAPKDYNFEPDTN